MEPHTKKKLFYYARIFNSKPVIIKKASLFSHKNNAES